MVKKITIAHSPDSDDAFMFYGLASGAVAVNGFAVDQVLADIETLNRAAFEGRYEVTAVSFHAYAYLTDRYALLPHGASMGDRYGPILVAKRGAADSSVAPSFPGLSEVEGSAASTASGGSAKLSGMRIAIPGRMTSAFLALRLYDDSFEPVVIPFDQIQQAVLDERVDAGLLIHEGQLTYQTEGLEKIVDLGEWWFDRTGLPLPLGGNIIRRDLGVEVMHTVSRMLHDSIAYALDHRTDAAKYSQQFGRGLNAHDTDRFVGMYVNQLTLDYGERGRAGLERFYSDAFDRGFIPAKIPVEFV
jgi:1,4-dihydroxy-6-naphthoate synthase